MRKLIVAALIAAGTISLAPQTASALGIFVGPRGGVRVGVGPRFGYGYGYRRYGYGYGWRRPFYRYGAVRPYRRVF